MSGTTSTPTPNAAPKPATAVTPPKELLVRLDTPYEEILSCDRAGGRVMFVPDKGSFKVLTDEEVAGLSAFTRSVYHSMAAINAKHDPVADDLAQRLKIGPTASRFGGPLDTVRNVQAARGLVHNYFRPDQLDEAIRQGWKVAGKGDITGGAQEVDGHFELRTLATGQTEQIAMVMPQDEYDRREIEFARERMNLGDQANEAAVEKVRETGYTPKRLSDDEL